MEPDTTLATQDSPARRTRRRNAWRLASWLALPVAAALIGGALPAVAAAADYYVAPNTGSGGTNVASFEQALDLADNAADADRILLGTYTYTPSNGFGFKYDRPDAPVEIIGQGAGETILTRPIAASGSVLRLEGGAGTSIHDLTIRLPQDAAGSSSGLSTDSTAQRIEVVEDPMQSSQRFGVYLYEGGTLEDSSVTLDGAQHTIAVAFYDGGAALRHSLLSAQSGVWAYYDGSIGRSRVTGAYEGVRVFGGETTITSSLIRYVDSGGFGALLARAQTGSDTTVNADGVTIVGPGGPYTYGASAGNYGGSAQNVHLNLTNSVIRGASNALDAGTHPGATGHATVAASYSDYDPSGNSTEENASIAESNVSNVGDASFVDAAGGNYHLLSGSPLIDMGDPAAAQGLDLDGDPLLADGNGDGTARRDLGAFEARAAAGGQQGAGGQPTGPPAADTQAPLISGFRATPSLFAVARAGTPLAARTPRGTRFRYTLSEAARVTLKIQRALAGRPTRYRTVGTLSRTGASGANSTKFSGRLRKRALRPGRYRVRITATDTAGNRSARRTTRFRIAAS